MSYLGIDLGTSGVKALLVDEAQRPLGAAVRPLAVRRPHPGWSEQDPAAWIAAAGAALDALAASHPAALAAVRGIGLSGQMHGAVLLDAGDAVLRPCMLWNDTRAHAEAAALDADPRFRAITGNIVFPGFTAPKLAWLRAAEPAAFAATRCVLLPKDFLRLWLTGERVSEMSDASGTGWLDVGARDWSEALLAATGLDRARMPRLVEGSAPAGGLRPALAARWGMAAGVSVAGGAGDNAAAALGAGIVAPGRALVSLGTSGVIFAATERFLPAPGTAVHAFCHALPGRWHQMGVMLSAASALDWFAGLAGQPVDALLAGAGGPAAPGRVSFLPYLSGERTPHNDPHVGGAFVGLRHGDGAGELARAVLDGIGFALRDNLDALRAAGARIERLTAVGGGARAGALLHAVANALGLPVEIPADAASIAALGAARLGMMAAEGAAPEAVCTALPLAGSCEPADALADAYAEGLARHRALYPALAAVAAGHRPGHRAGHRSRHGGAAPA
ncbi:xylulokinase [Paralimibaculum aggregatum]|uniref:Xylulose kinase n=1 Tax=Paralimibaculum aggregatum TaxID=3036245 RepID=A0ABQ6LK97_9RHOB|nr:xylulokinase [Limibaculum sp. NKW23]GMG82629.1 xylulokinase [Limibaculum sp. NKW23]